MHFEMEHLSYWQVFISIIIHAYWISNGFTEWIMQLRDIVVLYMTINQYWYACGGNNSITINASAIVNNDLFYGENKTIRTTKMDCGFSWKHKQKLLTDIFYQKNIGNVVFTRKIDENKQYHHEVIDGNSRLITLYEFLNNKITWNGKKYNQLSGKEKMTFSNYKIEIEFV
jgi:hypothetical protein